MLPSPCLQMGVAVVHSLITFHLFHLSCCELGQMIASHWLLGLYSCCNSCGPVLFFLFEELRQNSLLKHVDFCQGFLFSLTILFWLSFYLNTSWGKYLTYYLTYRCLTCRGNLICSMSVDALGLFKLLFPTWSSDASALHILDVSQFKHTCFKILGLALSYPLTKTCT